jgi:hypothetical protein
LLASLELPSSSLEKGDKYLLLYTIAMMVPQRTNSTSSIQFVQQLSIRYPSIGIRITRPPLFPEDVYKGLKGTN